MQSPRARSQFRCTCLVLLVLLSWGATTNAQVAPAATQPGSEPGAAPVQKPSQPVGDKTSPVEKKTGPGSREEQRQAQLVADTTRLLQLSQELKAEVAKSNKDTLSLTVIHKATEVETLARTLKERMRTP